MDTDADIKNFVKEIRRALPAEAAKTDEIMHGRGWESDQEAEHIWVEALADVTNMYIRQRNHARLNEQFRFFSEQFDRGSDAVRNCIDVSYVENLMWDLDVEDKKWTWPRIPHNLQSLYIAMWGKPSF